MGFIMCKISKLMLTMVFVLLFAYVSGLEAKVEFDDIKVDLLKPIPEKVVVLTFDDACASQATLVAPLLKKYGFGATFYVCEFGRNFSNNKLYMNWDQMRSLHEMGFEIGNHTLTHPGLSGKSLDYCKDQLKAIEDRCAANKIVSPTTFCWPGYSLNKPFYSVLAANGYTFARGGGQRPYDPLKDNPFNTPSFAVHDNFLKNKDNFANAAKQATAGKVVIYTFHGVPDLEHKWVNTDPARFEECMKYLKENNYTVIAMRDLADYVDVKKSVEQKYSDSRPAATLRMDARDHGIVLRYGDGPDKCDILGARDVWVFEDGGMYYMHYDAAGRKGWLSSLAVSKDMLTWEKKGPILDFGKPGEDDSKGACYGVTYKEGDQWHMFYLGTPNTSSKPNLIPSFPYLTMKAKANSPAGPWIKQKDVTPFRTKPATYYSMTASPGHVIKNGDEYLQFFSSTTRKPRNLCVQRTLGIARTKDLNGPWTVDPNPMVPVEEQIENSSLYYEKTNKTWFLFTNHIGIDKGEYTDAIWVYWSRDLNKWDPKHKAVVLDGQNCKWSKKCIGLPSVLQIGKRLALFYDAPGGSSISHMKRHVGLAFLDLPLKVPQVK